MYAKTKTTMKTKDIPLIGLEHFTKHPEHVTYMDENIAVIDSLTEIINLNEETGVAEDIQRICVYQK